MQKEKQRKKKLKFKNKIKEYRELRDIKLIDLANGMNKSLSTMWNLEKHKNFPRGETRVKLLKFFNCKFDDIFYEEYI